LQSMRHDEADRRDALVSVKGGLAALRAVSQMPLRHSLQAEAFARPLQARLLNLLQRATFQRRTPSRIVVSFCSAEQDHRGDSTRSRSTISTHKALAW
jgi:hypothetical protein